MRFGPVWNDLRCFLDDLAVVGDRVDRQLVARIGSAEQKPSAAVGYDVGHAVGERRRPDMGQMPARAVDRKARRRKIVTAQCGNDEPAIGCYRHRHAGGRWFVGTGNRDLVDHRQFAAVAVHREDIDLLAPGIRHIDDRIRPACGEGFPCNDQRTRQHHAAKAQREHPSSRQPSSHCHFLPIHPAVFAGVIIPTCGDRPCEAQRRSTISILVGHSTEPVLP